MICETNRMPTAEDNLGLAWKVTSKFVRDGRLEDSLEFSDACLGLVMAEKSFKNKVSPRTGEPIKFSTYAYHCIYNEILRGLKSRKRFDREKQLDLLQGLEDNDDPPHFELEEIYEFLTSGLDITEKHRRIFLEYLHSETQTEVAARWKLSKERVRQIIFYEAVPKIKEKYANFLAGLI